MSDNVINLGNVKLEAKALELIQQLQANDNEVLTEFINRLSRITIWIGKDLEGFDPACEDDMEAVRSINSISEAVQLLKTFKAR